MQATATHPQPKLSGELLTSYLHHGLKLDLYGELDDEGYQVQDIALAGSDVSLSELVAPTFFEDLSIWCDFNLPSAAELLRQSRDEARVEHAAWLEYA